MGVKYKTISSQDISDKVNKFEALATSSASRGQTGVTTASGPGKGLWFYCDGLRTPTTPTAAPITAMPGS